MGFGVIRLRIPRLHSIRTQEVFSGISDELRIAWMIHRFHSGDDVHQLWIVAVNVFDQLGFCIGWSCDEDGAGVRNRFGGFLKKIVILRSVPASDRIGFVMDVLGRIFRVQNKSLDVGRADMEHPRFMVIDPNDGVIVMLAHRVSLFLAIVDL